MSSEIVQVNFRMPAQLKATLEEAARANHRSLTAEIVARLEATVDPQRQNLFGFTDIPRTEFNTMVRDKIVVSIEDLAGLADLLIDAAKSIEGIAADARDASDP